MTAAKKPSSKSHALIKWDDELAKQAEIAASMEAYTGGGQFFSLKGGVLSWQDAPLPNNQMAVVILDSIFETTYYETEYDPDTPQSPTAFALGRDEKTLTWHENSDPRFAGKLCSESEVCQWGSAPRGRGKAARETRRLAMIPAGTLDQHGKFELFDEERLASASVGFMRLPVTSVKGYASFVKQVAGALRRPPFGIVTKVKVVPDPKTQFKVVFEPVMNIPDELMGIVMKRHEEAKAIIEFPYPPAEEEPAEPPRSSRAAQPPVGKARGRKY
jgi:hypothetical protein